MTRAPVYVVDGARTPFLKSKNRPGPFAAGDLAVQAGRALLVRQKFAPPDLDEVILGCAAPSVDEVNIGRVAALRMGCGEKVPGWTVMRNCASGMQALDSEAARDRRHRAAQVRPVEHEQHRQLEPPRELRGRALVRDRGQAVEQPERPLDERDVGALGAAPERPPQGLAPHQPGVEAMGRPSGDRLQGRRVVAVRAQRERRHR